MLIINFSRVSYIINFSRVINQHKIDSDEWEETIIKLWKKHMGMMKEEAMMEYLKLAQNLEMFGIHYFDIYNKKGSNLLLGIGALGLNVYKKEDKYVHHIP